MLSFEIRQKFLNFFKSKNHAVIPSASLIPEHDSTVLFITAGMQPLIPYLLGEKHPAGRRLVNYQKCLRTDDIDEVGDNRHLTFFEMLGNWSLGDKNGGYFKEESIRMSFEFLTDRRWLALDAEKIYVSVFEGDGDAPQDDESIKIWREEFKKAGIKAELGDSRRDPASQENARIFLFGKKDNWWGPAGRTGPCGPDTEMFYDTGRSHLPEFGASCVLNCDCGRYVEIWNNVFMEYYKETGGNYRKIDQKNVDTGMGLERIAAIKQNAGTIFETDLFSPIVDKIKSLSQISDGDNSRSIRIIADHLRAAVFILGDDFGIVPSNTERGYVLRRLIRRAARHGRKIGIKGIFTPIAAREIIELYGSVYPEIIRNNARVYTELETEERKFAIALEKGLEKFEEIMAGRPAAIGGREAFNLYDTFGFPLEITAELARERGVKVDEAAFGEEFKKHQEKSRAGGEQMFAGGLADHSEKVKRLHTATHLLHQALREILGEHVLQRGSNITRERLRFDFSHPEKMTIEEIKRVQNLINEKIKENLPVAAQEMSVEEARKLGAIGLFGDKYAELDKVKVYSIGDSIAGGRVFSREICGGPHIPLTSELGEFRIIKEEAVSRGVRRIKAVLL